MIRALLKRDKDQIAKIHHEFYEHEFELSQLDNLTCGFASVDAQDQVICAGGIKTIMEMIIVTDKNIDLARRQVALYDMFRTAGHSTKSAGYSSLHAFVTDEKWTRYLIKHVGFKPIVGTGLVIGV
jgi:hypothetical protein